MLLLLLLERLCVLLTVGPSLSPGHTQVAMG